MYLVKISNETIVNIENGVTYMWATREGGRSVRLILSSTLTEKDYRKLLKDDEAEILWNHLCSLANDLTQPVAQVEDETIRIGDAVEAVLDLTDNMLGASFTDYVKVQKGAYMKVVDPDVGNADYKRGLTVTVQLSSGGNWNVKPEWIKKVQS